MRKERFKINEELSVSQVVDDMTDDLVSQLNLQLKDSGLFISKDKSVLFKKGTVNFKCERYFKNIKVLDVIYAVYYLKSKEEWNFYNQNGFLACSADYENQNIKVNLAYVNNKPSDDFSSSIRHELKHIYEYDCGMKKNVSFYNKVYDRYKNGDKWEQTIAWALYLSFKTEQDAFLSQYYEYLKTHNPYNVKIINDYNNPYYQFDVAFDRVDRLNFTEEQLRQSFGLTINQLYHILESADERLFKKMTHVYQKFINDEKEKNKIIEMRRMNFLFECYDKGICTEESDIIW